MEVAVLGAGNGGCAVAFDWAQPAGQQALLTGAEALQTKPEPLPYGHRVDHQVQFLDETGCQQLASHKAGSAHRDLRLAGLVRQHGDHLDDVS